MSDSPSEKISPLQETRRVTVGGATPWLGGEPIALPAQLGRYQMLKLLGKGGMGAVYLAHDTQLDRKVALKIPNFPPNVAAAAVARFQREARAAASLCHPNICAVYDVGQIDGVHYLTMAYVEGESLKESLVAGQRLLLQQAVGLVQQLALAMQEAHDHGVIHRDLKPANVMINSKRQPVIMDFGLARREGAITEVQLTSSGCMIGTPAYMPPEQINGDVKAMGPASDIYSLGVILYELLTGRTPFGGSMIGDLMAQIMKEVPPPPSKHRADVDSDLDAICSRAMAKQPKDRFANCREFAAALQRWLKSKELHDTAVPDHTTLPVSPSRTASRRVAARRVQPSRWLAVTAIAVAAAAVLGLVFWLGLKASQPSASIAETSADTAPAATTTPRQPRPFERLRPTLPHPHTAPRAPERTTRPTEQASDSFSNSIGLRLVKIGAGEFLMGARDSDPLHDPDETPRHRVRISKAFYLGVYEVTQAQYEQVMSRNPSERKGANLPVEFVSYHDAVEFCRRLSALPAERAAGRTYRLPTEAEWEFACRAGAETVFHCGDSLGSTQANFNGEQPYGDAPRGPNLGRNADVGSYAPNAWGLYDMHGNVWEWCADWADGNYYAVSPENDPPGPPKSEKNWRILRGGGWDVAARYCRASNRFVGEPAMTGNNIGFRVACDVKK